MDDEREESGEASNGAPEKKSILERLEGRKFSRALKEIAFLVDEDKYILRELSTKDKEAYQDQLNKRVKTHGNDVIVNSFIGMQADLLCKCIFKEGSDKPITKEEFNALPSSMTQELFLAAYEMNGLTREGMEKLEEEAKNA